MRIAATRFAWPPADVDISAIPASSGAVEERRSGGAEDRARRDDIGYWKDVVDGKKQRKGLPEFGEVGPCGPRFWSQPYGHLPTSLRC